MDAPEWSIRDLTVDGLPELFAYLADHGRDNGHGDTPLFKPYPRGRLWATPERLAAFKVDLATPIGEPRWRRAWVALAEPDGAIVGHIDLRARPEPYTEHRALLGMGVHRDFRRRGLGRALIEHAIAWALRESTLEWIDLCYVAGNRPAERLYQRLGFQQLATIPDLFRVDQESISDVLMTKRIRG